jgi:hypothetical protein
VSRVCAARDPGDASPRLKTHMKSCCCCYNLAIQAPLLLQADMCSSAVLPTAGHAHWVCSGGSGWRHKANANSSIIAGRRHSPKVFSGLLVGVVTLALVFIGAPGAIMAAPPFAMLWVCLLQQNGGQR